MMKKCGCFKVNVKKKNKKNPFISFFQKMQTRNFADNAVVVDSLRKIVDGLDNKPGREK